jgi:hypothetical protein
MNRVRERREAVDVLQSHESNMFDTLSEMKSQPKEDIFSKNLRALRAAAIKSTQQKGRPMWGLT